MADYIQLAREQAETSTVLAANAGVLGAVFDAGDSSLSKQPGFGRFRAFVASDQAGTLYILQSRDNVTWYTTISVAVAVPPAALAALPGSPQEGNILESLITLRYVRAGFINGAVAQTRFEFDTCAVGI